MDSYVSTPQSGSCPLSGGSCDEVGAKVKAFCEPRPLLRGLHQFVLSRAIMECAYGTLFWNNRFFSSPSKDYSNAEQAAMPFHFRLSYWTMSSVLAVLFTFLFGASLKTLSPQYSIFELGGAMLLLAGTGWILNAGFILLGLRKNRLEFLSHTCTIMWQGTIPLALASPFLLFGLVWPWIPVLAVAFSSIFMFAQHLQRTRHLQLSLGWSLVWLLSLQSTFWLWYSLLQN